MQKCANRILVAAALAALYAGNLRADDLPLPLIEKVTFSFTTGNPAPTAMDIVGKNFGTIKPTVTLDGLTQAVTLFTTTHVTVSPLNPTGLTAGNYLLTLTRGGGNPFLNNLLSAQFDVAVGAVGAQGIQGPQGTQGIQGPQGSPGQPGENGSNGANGVSGYQIVVQTVSAGVSLSSTQTFTLSCPAGKVALAGTMNRLTAPVAGDDFSNRPATTPTTVSWAFDIFNRDLFAKNWQLTVTCVKAN